MNSSPNITEGLCPETWCEFCTCNFRSPNNPHGLCNQCIRENVLREHYGESAFIYDCDVCHSDADTWEVNDFFLCDECILKAMND